MKELQYATNFRVAYVFKSNALGDCTNHGISSTRDKLYIVDEDVTKEEVKQYCETRKDVTLDDFVYLKRRILSNKNCDILVPLKYQDTNVWTMFGGNYVEIDNIQADKLSIERGLLPLHDRTETYKESKELSI